MAAATLPSPSSASAAAVRTLARSLSPRHPLHLYPSRRGRHHPLAAAASSGVLRLRRPLSASASASAEGNNGAVPAGGGGREYDYDLFTIGAGSGGIRASRAASSLYGARAAVCEMPFATVASDALGGVGGTAVPSAVFSQPPIGQVGLSEGKAIKKYGDVDVYTANFRPLRATLSGLPDRVYMKVIVCANTNKVLGVHMCGEDAPEIIQGIAVAVKAGLTKQNFDATVGVHPTTAEEFVTMKNPTRKVRRDTSAEGKTKDEAVSQK